MTERERQALIRDLTRRLQLRGLDELRVIDRLLLRLELGAERYGELDLQKRRDWWSELREEILDALIYGACGELAREDHDRQRLRDEARAEMAEDEDRT